MFGIVVTLVAVIVAIVLAFCNSDDRSLDREPVLAWVREPRKK